jgi:hypothetical protein
MTLNILDIDLDFFLNDIHHGTVTSTKRLSNNEFKPWSHNDATYFLESHCGLSDISPIKGKYFIHHVEVFHFLRELQESNNFDLKFKIDHVDAHADLGTGDASYKYISTEILTLPLRDRAYPKKINGWEGLSSGNFLAFAIACRWIESLTYINETDPGDCQLFNLKNVLDPNDGIQLRQFSSQQMDQILRTGDMHVYSWTLSPLSIEPLVPFNVLDHKNFQSDCIYDYVFLTQSPGFTPPASDELIPLIKRYMTFD